ncbi:flagellar filament capping protein FliD [Campylobacter sp. faydin G-24]|uniref:Flagellar hook-associated protein 2 n=1 Tax=Campylobacter anatolicus TaxID=2829105 RepID=A0ABS5HJ95_9BACT|nr:flagellar filament capping protein FliD [Campylobacter anatolicus]MBR8464090.1 flagellar filament capping protein FliD [Campylobacter anatolicus]MBR8465995.1 flagellar filament capping protein FliD [Campylobacter anatolicus]
MALGTVTSLGLGSNVLTQEVIDKLKAADQKVQVTPITSKIEKNVTKQKDLSSIKTLVSTLKSSVSSLSNETLYLKRGTTSNGTSATLVAETGVNLQDFDIDVKQLAQRDVYQSSKFKSADSIIGKAGSFNLKFGGIDYKIEVKSSTSFQELADMINEKTGGDVQAKILNVGGDNPYQLILQSKNTGADNAITFGDIATSGTQNNGAVTSNELLKVFGWDTDNIESARISKAQDAEFTYNNVNIKRSSNEVKDLSVGLRLTLKETGKTSFKITEDTEAIKEEINNLVNSYNKLMNNLSVATDYNSETKNSGTFQGVNEITSIKSTINKILFSTKTIGDQDSFSLRSMAEDGNIKKIPRSSIFSLTDFGLSLSEDGLLKLDSSTLNSKLTSNLKEVQKFFTGSTTYSTVQVVGSKAVEAGELELTGNNLTINGTQIKLKTTSSHTSKQNALTLLQAINEAGISGVKASLNNSEDGIILKSTDGTTIDIKGDDNILNKFGLSSLSVSSKKTTTEGVFSSLNTALDGLTNKDNGSLTLYGKQLTNEKIKLETEKTKSAESLNTKYEIMSERFLAYDKVIANLERQFSTLKTMIDAELISKK